MTRDERKLAKYRNKEHVKFFSKLLPPEVFIDYDCKCPKGKKCERKRIPQFS